MQAFPSLQSRGGAPAIHELATGRPPNCCADGDLAPSDGAHCGEYRIIFAKRSGILNAAHRNLVIFESLMPNLQPQKGLKGCKEIARFWARLSREDDLERRAGMLERFYFTGLHGNDPVIHVDHPGAGPTGTGQIRTNQ